MDFFVALYRRILYNGLMASVAKMRAVAKYNAKSYSEIKVRMRKEDAEAFREYLNGRSANGFINEAITEKIEREKLQGKA